MMLILRTHDRSVWLFFEKMAEKEKQFVCVKFCFELGRTTTETKQMLKQGYGDAALFHTQIFKWFGRFSESRKSVNGDPRDGRPKKSVDDNQVWSEKNSCETDS